MSISTSFLRKNSIGKMEIQLYRLFSKSLTIRDARARVVGNKQDKKILGKVIMNYNLKTQVICQISPERNGPQ